MEVEIKTWLYDMLNAITEIESFFTDRPNSFAAYQADTSGRNGQLSETLRLSVRR